MPTEAIITLTVAALKKPLEELYDSATGPIRTKLKGLLAESKLRHLHKNITSVQKVKTMWQIDKEVKLLSFYYPSKVVVGDARRTITSISGIDNNHNFVIQGTVGQGKSIFLRYLCIKELAASKRVPLFVELRRHTASRSLRDFLLDAMGAYGFPKDPTVFEHLAESGKLVLLLDAFDEIDPASVTSLITEIELLAQTFPLLQIVITSRFDSGIERSPLFRVYKLAPLDASDHRPFLEKIIDNKARITELAKAIAQSNHQIKSLLTTPLLLTLLVIVYNATQEIPSSLTAFYDELFHTLISRHDKAKPGFKRVRACALDDSELKKLFEAFCYLTRQQDQLVLTTTELGANLERAASVTGIACKADAFAKDLTKAACVMQQEGLNFHFIHKSLAEFHAAAFIAHSIEDTAMKFYAGVLSSKWHKWRQELVFLSQLDKVRYLKYFYVPSAMEVLRVFGIDQSTIANPVSLTVEQTRQFMNAQTVEFRDPTTPENPPWRLLLGGYTNFVLDELRLMYIHPLFLRIKAGGSGDVAFGDYLRDIGALNEGVTLLTRAVNIIRERTLAATKTLTREARVGEFVDP